MAITNADIIAHEQQRLMKAGLIKPTGRVFKFETSDGIIELPEAEQIHTFAKWRELGYTVKKGEHAITRLTIWKYGTHKTNDDEADEENPHGYCFQKTACFFAAHQVEPMQAPAAKTA